MATRFATLFRDAATNARMQAWAQFVEDTLVTTGGWVVTGDAGQTLPSAMLACTAPNQKKGYRIYRMGDALQASAPVFLRLDYGCGSVNSPSFWVTIGTGSDGLGNITGILWNGGLTAGPTCTNNTSGASSTALNSYGSAGPSRVTLGLFVGVTPGFILVFGLERTKDATGADTADGLLAVYLDTANTVNKTRYVNCAVGTQPSEEIGLSYVLTAKNPSETFAPGDVGVGVLIHFKGVAQQPGMNVVVVNSNDVGPEGSFSMNLYGATRTFQHLNSIAVQKAMSNSSVQDSQVRCCIRYD